jgi:hypothetical protein
MTEEQVVEQAGGTTDPKKQRKELFNNLKSEGMFTKEYGDFESYYSDEAKIKDVLYKGLKDEGYVTVPYEQFRDAYFGDIVKKKGTPNSALPQESKQPSESSAQENTESGLRLPEYLIPEFENEVSTKAAEYQKLYEDRFAVQKQAVEKKYVKLVQSGSLSPEEAQAQADEELQSISNDNIAKMNEAMNIAYSDLGTRYQQRATSELSAKQKQAEEAAKKKRLEEIKSKDFIPADMQVLDRTGALSALNSAANFLWGGAKQIYNSAAHGLPIGMYAEDSEQLPDLKVESGRIGFNDNTSWGNIMKDRGYDSQILDLDRRISKGEKLEDLLKLSLKPELKSALQKVSKDADKNGIRSQFVAAANEEFKKRKVSNLKKIEEHSKESSELLKDFPQTWEEAKLSGNFSGYFGTSVGEAVGSSAVSAPFGFIPGARLMETGDAYKTALDYKAKALSKKYGEEVTPEDIILKGEDDDVMETAATVGNINAALETVGMMFGAGKLATSVFSKKVVKEVLKKNLGKQIGKTFLGAGLGVLGEGGTELTQGAVTTTGAKVAAGYDKPVNAFNNQMIGVFNEVFGRKLEAGQNIDEALAGATEEEVNELIESFRKGAIGGGALGGVSEVVSGVKEIRAKAEKLNDVNTTYKQVKANMDGLKVDAKAHIEKLIKDEDLVEDKNGNLIVVTEKGAQELQEVLSSVNDAINNTTKNTSTIAGKSVEELKNDKNIVEDKGEVSSITPEGVKQLDALTSFIVEEKSKTAPANFKVKPKTINEQLAASQKAGDITIDEKGNVSAATPQGKSILTSLVNKIGTAAEGLTTSETKTASAAQAQATPTETKLTTNEFSDSKAVDTWGNTMPIGKGRRLAKVLSKSFSVLKKVAPNLKIATYKSANEGAILESLGSEASQQPGSGFFNPKTNTVYINEELFGPDTPFHEAIHPIVNVFKAADPKTFERIANEASRRFLQLANNEKTTYGEYTEGDKEEALVEYLGDYADGKFETKGLEKAAQIIKDVINDILRALGLKSSDLKLDDTTDLHDVARTLADAFRRGTPIDVTKKGKSLIAKGKRNSEIQHQKKRKLDKEGNKKLTIKEQKEYVENKLKDTSKFTEAIPLKVTKTKEGKIKVDPKTKLPAFEKTPYNLKNGAKKFNKGMNEEQLVEKYSDTLAEDYHKHKSDEAVHAGIGWYSKMRDWLQRNFGADIEMFGQLLAATSPNTAVGQNFRYAIEALSSFAKGQYNEMLQEYHEHVTKVNAYSDQELEAMWRADKGKGTWSPKVKQVFFNKLINQYKEDGKPMPLTKAGNKYGMNSFGVLKALYGNWLQTTVGPKTKNFAGNLTGRSTEATIDVWAARYLRRVIYGPNEKQWRIQPAAETGVNFGVKLDGSMTGDYPFAEKIMGRAAKKLGINADDLQAFLWYLEKDVWDKNGWTASEGKKKASFEDEAKKLKLERYQLGITDFKDEGSFSEEMHHQDREKLLKSIQSIEGIVSARVEESQGGYGSYHEPSFDVEFVVEEGANVDKVFAQALEIAQQSKQESFFISRIVDEDHPNARPLVEIGFKNPVTDQAVADKLVAALEQANLKGHTLMMKRNKILGVRIQYVPEFDAYFNGVNFEDEAALSASFGSFTTNVENFKNTLTDEFKQEISYIANHAVDSDVINIAQYEQRKETKPFNADSQETRIQGYTESLKGFYVRENEQSGQSVEQRGTDDQVPGDNAGEVQRQRVRKMSKLATDLRDQQAAKFPDVVADIRNNPQAYSFYQLNYKEAYQKLEKLPSSQIEQQASGITTLIAAMQAGNETAVATNIALMRAYAREGKDATPVFRELRKLGTHVGQLLHQFRLLKAQQKQMTGSAYTADDVVYMVEKFLETDGLVQSQQEFDVLRNLAQAHIDVQTSLVTERDILHKTPTPQQAEKVIDLVKQEKKGFERMMKQIAKMGAITPIDLAITIIQGNALSPKSAMVNILGNTVFAIPKGAVDLIGTFSEWGADSWQGKETFNPFKVAWYGSGEYFKGMFTRKRRQNLLGDVKAFEQHKELHPIQAMVQVFTAAGRKTLPRNIKGNVPMQVYITKTMEALIAPLPAGMFKMLEIGDKIFTNAALRKEAYKEYSRALARGEKFNTFDDYLDNLPGVANEQLIQFAKEHTFANDTTLSRVISQGIAGAGIHLKDSPNPMHQAAYFFLRTGIFLFVKIPINITRFTIEMLYPEYAAYKAIRALRQGDHRGFGQEMGKIVVGVAMQRAFDTLVQAGFVTASLAEDSDDDKKEKWAKGGPGKINVDALARWAVSGGKDTSQKETDRRWNFTKLGPVGLMLLQRAEYAEYTKKNFGKTPQEMGYFTSDKQFAKLITTLQVPLELPFMQTLQGLTGIKEEKGLQKVVSSYMETMSLLLIPNTARQITDANMDHKNTAKDDSTIGLYGEKMVNKTQGVPVLKDILSIIPGYDESQKTLMPVIGLDGEYVNPNGKTMKPGSLMAYAHHLLNITDQVSDINPMLLEVVNVSRNANTQIPLSEPSRKVRLEGIEYTMPEVDFTTASIYAGKLKMALVYNFVNDDEYKTLTDAERIAAFKIINQNANDYAKNMIMSKLYSQDEKGDWILNDKIVLNEWSKKYEYKTLTPLEVDKIKQEMGELFESIQAAEEEGEEEKEEGYDEPIQEEEEEFNEEID